MIKFIVNNRTEALKTDFNLFFTVTNCRISRLRINPSHEFEIHVSVHMLTIKISQWVRENFCSYRKMSLLWFCKTTEQKYFGWSFTSQILFKKCNCHCRLSFGGEILFVRVVISAGDMTSALSLSLSNSEFNNNINIEFCDTMGVFQPFIICCGISRNILLFYDWSCFLSEAIRNDPLCLSYNGKKKHLKFVCCFSSIKGYHELGHFPAKICFFQSRAQWFPSLLVRLSFIFAIYVLRIWRFLGPILFTIKLFRRFFNSLKGIRFFSCIK